MHLFITFLLALNVMTVIADEPVCHRCEVIREENKKKVNPYEYYEDYLKNNPQCIADAEPEEKKTCSCEK